MLYQEAELRRNLIDGESSYLGHTCLKYIPAVKFCQCVHGRLFRCGLTITLSLTCLLPAASSDRARKSSVKMRGHASCT